MTFPILGGNGAVAGYEIDNSLRFNHSDSAYLSRTQSAGNRKTFTASVWVKRSRVNDRQAIFSATTDGSNECFIWFDTNDELFVKENTSNSTDFELRTNRKFRDVGAFYHLVIAYDTSNATSGDRVRIYVNGVEETSFANETQPTQNFETKFNKNAQDINIGRMNYNAEYFGGYLSEIHWIDGQQLSPTDFGEFDEDSGIWKPKKYSGSYGTNGFYLDFSNSSTLGEDFSGNDNDFTATNLASTDQTTDTPTNNFATLNPLSDLNCTFSEGNVEVIRASDSATSCVSTIAPTSGKWYYEFQLSAGNNVAIGVAGLDDWQSGTDLNNYANKSAVMLIEASYNASIGYVASSSSATTLQNSTNLNTAKYGMAVDLDNGNMYASANGSWYSSVSGAFDKANFSDATAIVTDIPTGEPMAMAFRIAQSSAYINFGNAGGDDTISSGNSDGNGYGNFEYAPPSGYLALCTQNLATELSPTIDDGSAYFQTTIYTGNDTDGTQITNSGNSDLKPDWLWIKNRTDSGTSPATGGIWDSTRGFAENKVLTSFTTNAEGANANGFAVATTDGFTVEDGTSGANPRTATNKNAKNYVAWQWKANGGTTSSNTDGSITSTVQANTTAGFSIVTYTGNATGGATIGHGLGVKPDMIWVKSRSLSTDWLILHQAYEGTSAENMRLNTMALASADDQAGSGWHRTAPTSSVFSVGDGQAGDYTSSTNQSGATHVAYCFASIEGYSKISSYTGNGSSDGTFVYTGFRPAWVMFKRTSQTESWVIADNKRDTDNPVGNYLLADSSGAEASGVVYDFLSNGIKFRNASQNESGATYIYMCFAENPFVSSSGVPVTAR